MTCLVSGRGEACGSPYGCQTQNGGPASLRPVGLPFAGRAGLADGEPGRSCGGPEDATEQGDEADKAR
jgi:hypothetical protein